MEDFEKLGVFYLGQTGERLVLYPSKNLTTHAVCIGMTGSGKTGLCLGLVEEAAIDGVPVLAIDPKGDLANVLLTFAPLTAAAIAPWLEPGSDAEKTVQCWRAGRAGSGKAGARIARLRDGADFSIYTPGSSAGLPLSIMSSLMAPPVELVAEADALRERVQATVAGLLALAGVDADPVRSRESVLLSSLVDRAWRAGQNLDLAALIQQLQQPPLERVGALDLESFFPARDRFTLAVALNQLLASPAFAAWRDGDPLDVQRLLYTAEGKPRVSIVSIAHLGDAERMFVVTQLFNAVVGWMRTQSGTGSLRAILYMDEMAGYIPPVANPPSKAPLLTLLKQGRAFGLGVVLASQNPIDLDYKALANAGTWFVGRLQTERDKARVMEGLEGAAASASRPFDRGAMERTLAGLGNRVFLLHDVRADQPVTFQTRWTLSYLRGPLSRDEIRRLMDPRKRIAAPATGGAVPPTRSEPTPGAATPASTGGTAAATPSLRSERAPATATGGATGAAASAPPFRSEAATMAADQGDGTRAVLPAGVRQHFAPLAPGRSSAIYQPFFLASLSVRFFAPKLGVDHAVEGLTLAPITNGAIPIDWNAAQELTLAIDHLDTEPAPVARFMSLPAPGAQPKSYDRWGKELAAWMQAHQVLELWSSPSTEEVSRPGEAEGDFRARLAHESREDRDRAVDKLRARYAAKLAALDEKIRRAQQSAERQSDQARSAQLDTALNVGASVLGALLGGRKATRAITSGARSAGRAVQQSRDVSRAKETVAALQEQRAKLQQQIDDEVAELAAARDPQTELLEPTQVRPRKTDVQVRYVALLWMPR